MTQFTRIDLVFRDNIALLTLADPETLNAVSISMVEELLAAVDQAASKARCLLLTGRGRGFCSGANIAGGGSDSEEGPNDAGAYLDTHYNPLMQRLRQLPIPLVTAVNGPAAGIGAAIGLAGDLIVASETAFFLQAFRNIGLVPDGGTAFLLVHAAGRARASEMMLLGERLPAATALEWGLINRVVPPEQLFDTAFGFATALATGPTTVLAKIRRLCWDAAECSYADMLARERQLQREAGRTFDHREGIAAFQAKRKPVFTGM